MFFGKQDNALFAKECFLTKISISENFFITQTPSTRGPFTKYVTHFFDIFDPPPPPCTQYDVIVTIDLPLLRTQWTNPSLPPACVRTKCMPPNRTET